MKSEERHRLQETELEKWGRNARDFWDSFSKQYGKILLIGLAAVVVVAAAIAWYVISSRNAEAERWKEVISASFDRDPSQSLVQLAEAASKYSDYPAGQWAALMEAERALSEGIRLSRTDRPAAVEELTRARDAFADLANAESDIIQERRAWGMARTLETLAGVDMSKDKKGENVKGVEDARNAYEKFVEEYENSIFRPLAEKRIADLKSGQAQDFYVWYSEQYPRPEDRPTPEGGTTPGSGLPEGHPPISPGQMPPTGPSFPTQPGAPTAGEMETEESVFQELESIVGGEDQLEETPKTETPMTPPNNSEPPKGPTLPAPGTGNADNNKPAEPAPAAPKTEDKPPAEPAPAKPEEKTPEDSAPAKAESN